MPKNFGAITDPKDLVTKEYADGVVVANPTLVGTESDLSGIQIGNTKYKIAGEDAATREMIAPIEETSTATAAHGLGQCFVYNGVLYRALTNIAIGDTITPNTNCVQTNLAMNFTRSVPLTSAQYNLLTTAEKNAEIMYVITDDNGGGIGPYISNPVMDGVASPGSSDLYARGDHVHPSDTSKADKSDLASISVTGTTNTTGATISNGTYFYLNGSLVQATADIASGATFTSGTNYSSVTAGGLNALKSAIIPYHIITGTTPSDGSTVPTIAYPSGYNYSNTIVLTAWIVRWSHHYWRPHWVYNDANGIGFEYENGWTNCNYGIVIRKINEVL